MAAFLGLPHDRQRSNEKTEYQRWILSLTEIAPTIASDLVGSRLKDWV